jgi:putative sigma-54 modulation protein
MILTATFSSNRVAPSLPAPNIRSYIHDVTQEKGVVMNITTTARHYDLAPSLKDYAEGKVLNLKKYFDHIVTAHIIFSLEKYRQRVEITLHVNGKDFITLQESEDMYLSVDRAIEKIEEQLKRYSGRLKRRKKAQGLGEVSGTVGEGE